MPLPILPSCISRRATPLTARQGIGNEAVVDLIDAPGMSSAGYTNISTSDDETHGQVKQAANFAYARIYEVRWPSPSLSSPSKRSFNQHLTIDAMQAGHEVPFYQPLLALALFNRSIHRLDIATGATLIAPNSSYRTAGPSKSTYREGNATVQFDVLPANATYNVDTDMPVVPSNSTGASGSEKKRVKRSSEVKRVLSRQGAFVPPGRKRQSAGRSMGTMPWPRS